MIAAVPVFVALAGLVSTVSGHACMWHNSMYGFNVTDKTFSYDNRPQVPLYNMNFDQWWMHGHKDYPPNPGDFLELPAGGKINAEISCDKGATSWYPSSEGGDVGFGSDFACPGAQPSAIHATGIDDVKGCALAIAYQSDVNALKPDDFTIFSVNHTCVWYLNTEFEVPKLPACPEEGCHCAWFWIHSIDSGSEQIYMNAYKCKVTGDVGAQPLGKPALPRRCGADPDNGRSSATPGNCTVGAKLPMYWYQNEGNNMFEGTYEAPYYNDLYGFSDGAQHDIFYDGTIASQASFTVTTPASAPTTHASSSAPAATSSVAASNPEPPSSNPEPASSSAPEPTTSVAEATTSAAEATTVQSSAAASASSPATCRKRNSTKKRDAKAKRSHARHLSGLHH